MGAFQYMITFILNDQRPQNLRDKGPPHGVKYTEHSTNQIFPKEKNLQ